MSAANGSAIPGGNVTDSKGKARAADQLQAHDTSMNEEEDSSEEESGVEEPVVEVEEEVDDDNMDEIDTSNIILGPRTRGKRIDFAEAAEKAKEAGDTLEDDDEDDDEDFEEAEVEYVDKMEE